MVSQFLVKFVLELIKRERIVREGSRERTLLSVTTPAAADRLALTDVERRGRWPKSAVATSE